MKATPLFLPQLLGDIKHLRWTLMQVLTSLVPPHLLHQSGVGGGRRMSNHGWAARENVRLI
jgi:hypothetical protein